MQTLAQKASGFVCWDQMDLPNGVYRIENARWLDKAPDLTNWIDCSDSWQFRDELQIALNMLGKSADGVWIGMGGVVHGICTGVAWLVS